MAILEYLANDLDLSRFNKLVHSSIVSAYIADMRKYTTSSTQTLKISDTYESVPKQLGDENKKFKYSKISTNANRRDYETSIEWLIAANLVYKCGLVKRPEMPIAVYEDEKHFKLYISDVGILNNMADIEFLSIIENNDIMYRGVLSENFVAQTFRANNIRLFFWKSDSIAEIDFLIQDTAGNVVPVEVKAGDNVKSKSLNAYIEKYKPKYAIRISTKNFGKENNIHSIPLYATHLIKNRYSV